MFALSSPELTDFYAADENHAFSWGPSSHDMASKLPAICKMSRKASVYHLLSFWPLTYWQRNVKSIFKESPYCRNRLKGDEFGRLKFAVGENPGPKREGIWLMPQPVQPPGIKWEPPACKELQLMWYLLSNYFVPAFYELFHSIFNKHMSFRDYNSSLFYKS